MINMHILKFSRIFISSKVKQVPTAQVAIILGAAVYQGKYLSAILKDRTDTAIKLYNNKKVKKILVSGDHGREYYDEVNIVRKYLLKKGVRPRDIFLDHAGFRTYDSMVRAKTIFQIKKAIIVTQRYHLYRSLFIARKQGINAYGLTSNLRPYLWIKRYKIREYFARVKAWFDNLLKRKAKFAGKKISILGDGRKTWDSH